MIQYPYRFMVVALPAEARPLNHHFDLHRDHHFTAFPLYRKGSVVLAISGVGCESACRTVLGLQAYIQPPADCIWLNIGIAGHPSRDIGQVVLAREIRDENDGRCWSVPQPIAAGWDTDLLISRSKPETEYSREALYDMEAAGFFRAASRLASPGLIHSLKIVSDNREHPATALNGKRVSQLIGECLDRVERMMQQLESMK